MNRLFACADDVIHASSGNLEPRHLKTLLSSLQTSNNPSERRQILLTLGNAAAFTVNQVVKSILLSRNKTHFDLIKCAVHAIFYLICNVYFSIFTWTPQNLIREFEGIHIIAGFLSDPAAEVRVQTLNALNNLCMNIPNQDQVKVCCQALDGKHRTYDL